MLPIPLGIANFNWVFKISKKFSFVYFFFQLGIFVNVNTSHEFTFFSRHIHFRREATFSFYLRVVYLIYDFECPPDKLVNQFINNFYNNWLRVER